MYTTTIADLLLLLLLFSNVNGEWNVNVFELKLIEGGIIAGQRHYNLSYYNI